MKYYFAGALNFVNLIGIKELGVKRVLSSWLEGKADQYPSFEMFIDSGAFTAWTQGKTININDYIRFIKQYEPYLEVYANLDVVGDAIATQKNQELMEKEGLHPLPTFHLGEDFSHLEEYLKKYDYIALGGTVGSKRDIIEPFLDNCFARIKKHWPKKIHGFGIGSLWAMKKYPFYSVDSTSWLVGGRYGQVYNHTKLSGDSVTRNKHSKIYSKVMNYKEMGRKNIRTYLQLEKDISYYWSKRGIIWKT